MEIKQVIKPENIGIDISTPTRKTVLICLNGFQVTDVHDAQPMKDYFDNNFAYEYDNCEVATVYAYLPAEKETHGKRDLEKAVKKAIEEYIAKGYDIILMGYSFSCSLASKMQYKYRNYIKRVIFVAPIYDSLVNGMIPHYISYYNKFRRLKKKYGKRLAKTMGRTTVRGMGGLLINIFRSLLANRHYFSKVKADALVIWGTDDILCTEHSVNKVMKKLKGKHVIYKYPGVTHGALKNIRDNGLIYEDILNFCFNTPYLLDRETIIENKAEEKIRQYVDEDGEKIPTFVEIFNSMDPEGDKETRLDQEGL